MKKRATGQPPEATRKILHHECDELKKEIERLTAEKNRLDQEIENQKIISHYQMRKSLLGVLEIIDAYERLISHAEQQASEIKDPVVVAWLGNMKAVYKLMMRFLQSNGVETIVVEKGEKADPERHMVSEVIEDPEYENEEIVEVIKRGYRWRGSLLRPAEVKTVLNQPTGEPGNGSKNQG